MKISSFEYALAKLDRQVWAANVRYRCLVAQRQRYLATAVKPQSDPKAPLVGGEDLLFNKDGLLSKNVDPTVLQ